MKTIKCTKCDWITDIEIYNPTNPTHCPKCGYDIIDANSGELFLQDELDENYNENCENERMGQ